MNMQFRKMGEKDLFFTQNANAQLFINNDRDLAANQH